MIENVRQTFLDSLPTVDWMDKTTESLAVEKARAIVDKVVSPSWILDNNKLNEYYDKVSSFDHVIQGRIHCGKRRGKQWVVKIGTLQRGALMKTYSKLTCMTIWKHLGDNIQYKND